MPKDLLIGYLVFQPLFICLTYFNEFGDWLVVNYKCVAVKKLKDTEIN